MARTDTGADDLYVARRICRDGQPLAILSRPLPLGLARAAWADALVGGPADIAPAPGGDCARLGALDAPEIVSHVLRLSREDRHSRFHGAVSDDFVVRRYAALDWPGCVVVGCRLGDTLVGVAEAVICGRDAEVGVSVEAAARGRGVGRALVRHAAGIAAAMGASRTGLYFLRGSTPIPRIVKSLGGSVDLAEAEGWIIPSATEWWMGHAA